jgi:hypothetical protein
VVRRRIDIELNRVNPGKIVSKCLGEAVPAIHNGAVRGQDDWKREIRLIHELYMLDQVAPRTGFIISSPWLIELANAVKRNMLARKPARQLNEPIHIPGEQTLGGFPEEVLLPHVRYSHVHPIALIRATFASRKHAVDELAENVFVGSFSIGLGHRFFLTL